MQIAITGASGSVGSALIRRLQAAGEHDIVAVARRTPDYAVMDGPRWVSIDLSVPDSGHLLRLAVSGADAVVHLAWGFQPSHQVEYLEAVGVGGTQRVLDACAAMDVGQIVHMSSVGAYSPKRDMSPVDERWPVNGVPSSSYSRHKVAAERLLDSFEQTVDGTAVARLRPGIIGQRSAGSALLRYALPALLPAKAVNAVPVLPMPAGLSIAMVHADDVADAIVRVLQQRAVGAFNLAAAMPISAAMIADALGARWLDTPIWLVRALMRATWQARLQPVAPGWLDLGCAAPALDSTRARQELGWSPAIDSITVLRETLDGMGHAAAGSTAVLRRRTVLGELSDLVGRGLVSHRRLP
ncbi:NAD-dependent epimerase/dehydratase family protein [Kribbella jiaozuonensis]|uniref:NAD-dependent epimerase/dehydratase family protein n=1 Tax=Kribbella jiaozuonensis TaxID=2575441 RepID=A0A4U3LKB2_9ACTN|nr:NAD-dependent epimerase/dehydratase family protein [Kribbella jiaozuonensis]TKK76158.1 NAD-dependent epimerase/dehydratase family protein [Kribbella jiaozuonensis]